MITIEEAEADRDAEMAREDALDNLETQSDGSDSIRPSYLHSGPPKKVGVNKDLHMSAKVVAKLPSFRFSRSTKVPNTRASFFKSVFSSRKLNRVAVSDEDIFSEDSQRTDDDSSQVSHNQRRRDQPADGEEEKDDEPLPPMPNLGKPVNMDLLNNRNHSAIRSMDILMDMVDTDVGRTLSIVKGIPVGADYDRTTVTPEISKAIAQVRSSFGIDKRLKEHVVSTQQALNYRRSSLIMMNSNYHHQLVRKLEPIYVNEARTIVVHKD